MKGQPQGLFLLETIIMLSITIYIKFFEFKITYTLSVKLFRVQIYKRLPPFKKKFTFNFIFLLSCYNMLKQWSMYDINLRQCDKNNHDFVFGMK